MFLSFAIKPINHVNNLIRLLILIYNLQKERNFHGLVRPTNSIDISLRSKSSLNYLLPANVACSLSICREDGCTVGMQSDNSLIMSDCSCGYLNRH